MNKYDCSVNCIAWAPSEYGITLVAGLSSGKITIIKYLPEHEQWSQHIIEAHDSSVNAISIYSGNQEGDKEMKFASCSCDNQVYEWRKDQATGEWISDKVGFHDEWVRDVAYANSPAGSSARRIVSGGEDNKVKIFVKEGNDGEWNLETELVKDAPVWRVGFSFTGNLLSVCSGDNNTSIYKEKALGSGEWVQESLLNDEGVVKEKAR
jgi:protein transport protein SEC13